jgi:hypothetical protein
MVHKTPSQLIAGHITIRGPRWGGLWFRASKTPHLNGKKLDEAAHAYHPSCSGKVKQEDCSPGWLGDSEIISPKLLEQKSCRHGSSSTVPAQQAESPKFKLQDHQNKKQTNIKNGKTVNVTTSHFSIAAVVIHQF